MKALAWRIYLTVLAVLLLFALGAGWIAERQREQAQHAEAPAMGVWDEDDPYGAGWDDWAQLVLLPAPRAVPWWVGTGGLLALLGVLYLGIAAGAYPVVRRLTRRLEALRQGVEAFGDGQLDHRVAVEGQDEVAALAASFNRAAARIEALVRAHQTLLANASHELRSPLARLRVALALLEGDAPAARTARWQEIERNIRELDALVDEVLLASRLQAAPPLVRAPVDLLGLAAEEGVASGADVGGEALLVPGDERLLRRAIRNLLENAHRYAPQQPPEVRVRRVHGAAELWVCDRGPGVPPEARERIFEPFYRLPGHAEHEGGVGLGLSLVRQIARHHGGDVRCEPRAGGGSCFVLWLPLDAAVAVPQPQR